MISHKAIVAVAALATASLCKSVYYGLAGKTHSPSLSSYVVVDTQGQRIAVLLDASRPPSAEQLAVFQEYSPYFGKIRSGSCSLNRAAQQSRWTKLTTRLSSLVSTTVHAQGSCVYSYYIETWCPDCYSAVCSGYGPGCAQGVNSDCNCYEVEYCDPNG